MQSTASYIMDIVLRMLRREYEEQLVQVIVLQDTGPVFTVEGVVSLTRGTEYSLPLWVALELSRRGLVKFKEEPVDIGKLAKIAYNEESTLKKPSFTKVEPYFYNMVIDEINRLYRKLEEEKNPMILSDIQKMEDYLLRIGRTRVRKLIQLLFIEPPQEIRNKLSEEEKILYQILKDSLKLWMMRLRIEKGE